jgi:hypothetical protein
MDQCRAAEKAYGEAVAGASQLEGKEFEQACAHAEKAKKAFQKAEEAVKRHTRDHSCFNHTGAQAVA